MALRNAFKILLNNFSIIWKILLYRIIVFIITCGLIAGLVLPNVITIIKSVADTGLFANVQKLIGDFFARGIDLTANVETIKESLEAASITLAQNADRLVITYIFIAIIYILGRVISGLSQLATSDVINADMSSCAKYGFLARFTVTLGKSFRYQLIKLITEFPCLIIIAYVVYTTFSLLFNVIGIFSLFFSLALFILLISCMQTFFICWLPQITVEKQPIFDSIRLGFSLSRHYFAKNLSYFILINLSLFMINILLAFFTCGVGLVISLPIGSLFFIVYRLVIFYEYKNYKYYIDINTIIDPANRPVNGN